jgi:hypothetical protein
MIPNDRAFGGKTFLNTKAKHSTAGIIFEKQEATHCASESSQQNRRIDRELHCSSRILRESCG